MGFHLLIILDYRIQVVISFVYCRPHSEFSDKHKRKMPTLSFHGVRLDVQQSSVYQPISAIRIKFGIFEQVLRKKFRWKYKCNTIFLKMQPSVETHGGFVYIIDHKPHSARCEFAIVCEHRQPSCSFSLLYLTSDKCQRV